MRAGGIGRGAGDSRSAALRRRRRTRHRRLPSATATPYRRRAADRSLPASLTKRPTADRTRAAAGTRPAGRLRRGRGAARHRLRRAGRAIVAVLGPNGAGKTTLCSVITGLVPADAGTVILDGVELHGRPAHKRSRGRSRARARIAWHLRRADRRGESAPGARRRPARSGLPPLPGAARAPQAGGRRAVGRRAADADPRAAARPSRRGCSSPTSRHSAWRRW